jgi:hypothetical protein
MRMSPVRLAVAAVALVAAAAGGIVLLSSRGARAVASAPSDREAGARPRKARPAPQPDDRGELRRVLARTLAARERAGDHAGAAEIAALLSQEAFVRAARVVDAWMTQPLPRAGLLPRAWRPGAASSVWSYRDTAADCFSHFVIAAHLVAPDHRAALDAMLRTERSLNPELPRTIDVTSGAPVRENDVERVFGAVEYAKDGLLPIVEATGDALYLERLHAVVGQIIRHLPVASQYGPLPSAGTEKNGEMLQVLARLARRRPTKEYLELGRRIADAYWLEVIPGNGGLPADTWDFAAHRPLAPWLSLRDHGNEIVAGLVEWTLLEVELGGDRERLGRAAVEGVLDRILEIGVRADGQFSELPLGAAPPARAQPTLNDNWGYVAAAYAAYARSLPAGAPRRERYLGAARRALAAATATRAASWGGGTFDGHADAIESALYLHEVFRDGETPEWLDGEIGVMFAAQKPDGFVGRFYLDGNFVRTALLYGLFRTAGVRAKPWSPALRLGAVVAGNELYLHVEATEAWQGVVSLDRPRHAEHLGLTASYPRLNAWPEWYAVAGGRRYLVVTEEGGERLADGGEFSGAGLALRLAAGESRRLRIRPADPVRPQ